MTYSCLQLTRFQRVYRSASQSNLSILAKNYFLFSCESSNVCVFTGVKWLDEWKIMNGIVFAVRCSRPVWRIIEQFSLQRQAGNNKVIINRRTRPDEKRVPPEHKTNTTSLTQAFLWWNVKKIFPINYTNCVTSIA